MKYVQSNGLIGDVVFWNGETFSEGPDWLISRSHRSENAIGAIIKNYDGTLTYKKGECDIITIPKDRYIVQFHDSPLNVYADPGFSLYFKPCVEPDPCETMGSVAQTVVKTCTANPYTYYPKINSIEAVQWNGKDFVCGAYDRPQWLIDAFMRPQGRGNISHHDSQSLSITTFNGNKIANKGWWVIKKESGEITAMCETDFNEFYDRSEQK